MRDVLEHCAGTPEREFAATEVLLAEGDRAGVLYILIDGEVEIVKGDFQITVVSEPGSIFGETSVLLDIPHTATVRALTACRAHVIDNAREFLNSTPDITYQLARLLAQRLHGVNSYLVDLKRQFEDQSNHLGMVDVVLETLVHQQEEECSPGSDRDPNTTL
jgi:CRP/FNR family cyclic AMP-dependent transcriptional regulator